MPELDADAHDGCYELVRAVIDAYRDVDEAVIDYKDLNTVYLMTVGTWRHGTPAKKGLSMTAIYLKIPQGKVDRLLDKIKEKAAAGGYDKRNLVMKGLLAYLEPVYILFKVRQTMSQPVLLLRCALI